MATAGLTWMTCRELTELVTDRLEGRLGLGARLRFEWHLGLCRDCRAYLRQVRASLAALRRLGAPVPTPPPEVEAELRRRFTAWAAGGGAGDASRTDRPRR